uniref:Peptidase A1 domain-containing protein n=1 Tax=Ditylenchus dipsaci TaxID=166011 RepID=A0A915E7C8_9BILA
MRVIAGLLTVVLWIKVSQAEVLKLSLTHVQSKRMRSIKEDYYRQSTSKLLVILDTGSSNLWIPDSECNANATCNNYCSISSLYCVYQCDSYCCIGSNSTKTSCDKKSRFDRNASSTYEKDGRSFAIHYGTGFADGFMGRDTLGLGAAGSPQLLIQNQTFARPLLSPISGADPPLINAINQGLLEEPIFTVYLTSTNNTEGLPSPGGLFTYGGLDNENCGPVIDYVNLSSTTYYQFPIEGVHVGDKYIIKGIAEAVGAKYDSSIQLYTVGCQAEFPPVVFTINGKQYSLTSDVLTVQLKENECILGISPSGGGLVEMEDLTGYWVTLLSANTAIFLI